MRRQPEPPPLFFKRATRSPMFREGKSTSITPRYNHEGSGCAARRGKDDQQRRMEADAGTPSEIVCEKKKKKKKKNNAMLQGGGRKKKAWLATFG